MDVVIVEDVRGRLDLRHRVNDVLETHLRRAEDDGKVEGLIADSERGVVDPDRLAFVSLGEGARKP